MLFIRTPKFGAMPKGQRLSYMQQAANYKNGAFQNEEDTPVLPEGQTYGGLIKYMFFTPNVNPKPTATLHSKKTDLVNLNPATDTIVWFGHSSYFMQVAGKKILVDPVFSGAASPIKFTTPSFPGSDVYTVDDMPSIDYLFITHDHWDHMDYETVLKLKPKVKKIITSLGVGAHLERWGFAPGTFIETNWGDKAELETGFTVNNTSARHFSGRGFKRAQSVWSSFVLTTPTKKIFIGGDSGYGPHFKRIGQEFGPFNIAILECGQYDTHWKHIHMMPEQTVQAAKDLNAEWLMPVHWAKFRLAKHAWNDSIKRVTVAAKQANLPVITPMIGEQVEMDKPITGAWWEQMG